MRTRFLATILGAALATAAAAQSPPVLFQTPMSPRNANYTIEASLDPVKHALKGEERIRWRNIQQSPATDAWFHLYFNAFANNQSVFMKESGGQHRQFQFDDKSWGYCRVTAIAQIVEGKAVPLKQMFPREDRTVMRVELAAPVPPGGEAQFVVTFEDQLPKVFARAGYLGAFHMMGQWFPKLGVFKGGGGWNCHEYHLNSEFFSDFGVYDVAVTVPKAYVVGATGVLWKEADTGDTKTLSFHAEDVHDFAWTASPDFVVAEETWNKVKIRVLMQPINRGDIPRYMASVKRSLDDFGRWLWPYPYSQITVVDPPLGGEGAGGMEYPALITADANPFIPRSILFSEMVTVHEFGHQYWYGMSANNEFEEAWLDEGINSYYESRVMDEWFGPGRSIVDGFAGWRMGDVAMQRLSYIGIPGLDPIVLPSWNYVSNGVYNAMSYAKPVLVLKTLEGILGKAKMDEVMKAFFMKVKFTHPTTEDFLRITSEAAGRDLGPLLRPMLYGTGTVDFKVARVASLPEEALKGYDMNAGPPKRIGKADAADPSRVGKGKDKAKEGNRTKEKRLYDSVVVIQRKGELVVPVEVLVAFEDGTSKRETWDGQGRYTTFRYHGAQVVKVVVDPDGKVPLDIRRLNNGWVKEGDGLPARALKARLRTGVQGLLVLFLNWM